MNWEPSAKAQKRLEEILELYPQKRSAVMPALYLCQEELGCLDERAVDWVAARLQIPPVQVQELVTFYSMYHARPPGRYHFQVCRTLSCAVCGGRDLSAFLQARFNLKPGEVSADGMWSLEEVECLGSCGTAPVCLINDVLFEKLTPEKLAQLIERIEKEKPDLKFSSILNALGEGLPDRPRSEII